MRVRGWNRWREVPSWNGHPLFNCLALLDCRHVGKFLFIRIPLTFPHSSTHKPIWRLGRVAAHEPFRKAGNPVYPARKFGSLFCDKLYLRHRLTPIPRSFHFYLFKVWKAAPGCSINPYIDIAISIEFEINNTLIPRGPCSTDLVTSCLRSLPTLDAKKRLLFHEFVW